MNNVLAYFGGFLAVVLAALFAVPALIDWNGYRGIFEEEASKVLGRDVRVGGGVNLRLLPTPYVKFERVRLADVSGNTGEPFIRVESFTMRLSGPALLRGVFEATQIELSKPVLTLALDGAGGGNWNTISLQPGALPFAPRDVTLRSVRLIDGVVSVYAPDSAVVTRIEAINGELSADAISGPFRFKGEAKWSGAAREIRFATTALDGAGSFRIKAASRAPATGNTFNVDAEVNDFTSVPKLAGELTGRIAVPGANDKTDAIPAVAGDDQRPTMELKSTVKADAGGASLSDITLSLENAAEPQLITGTASAKWLGDSRLDVALASKWLDFDRLAGAGQDSAPFLKIKQLALGVIAAVAGDGAADAKIDVEQIKVGGETVGGLKIDAERRNGAVRLKELRAGLPGGSRLGLIGDIQSTESGGVSFVGDGFVNGTSLARLKTWAEKSGATIDIGPDGAFSAEGKVHISGQRFELTEASAEISGRAMTGEVKIIDDGRHRAEITVESVQLERGDLFPETTKALEAAIRRAIGVAGATADAPVAPDTRGENIDISLRILAGELKRGAEIYRDVDATVALENGDIRVPSAKFTTAAGLAVSVEGRIDDKDGAPFGTVAFDAAGATPAAMRDLVRVLGIEGLVPPDRAERFGSAKIAGLVQLGARSAKSADVSFDGLLAGSRLSVHGAFDAGLAEWRRHASQVRINLKAPAIGDLASALGVSKKSVASAGARPVDLVLTASGALEKGSAARLDIAGEGLAIGYDGTLAWSEGKPIDANGRMTLAARDVGDALTLAGVGYASALKGAGVQGVIDVERQDGEWALATQGVTLGATAVRGALTMATGAEGAAIVAGDLSVDHIVISGLLAPFIDGAAIGPLQPSAGAPPATIEAIIEEAPRAPAWPDGRFNFSALDGVSGDVALKFSRLTIGEGVQVRSGSMTIALAPGKLGLSKLSGTAAGGQLDGDVSLEASQSGVAGTAKIAINRADLSALGAAARGRANLELTLNGQALSPVALIASLHGEGKATLDGATISGPNHAAARSVVDAVLQGKIDNEPDAVTVALKNALTNSAVDLGSRALDVKISNGVASIAPIELEDAAGTTSATASLDLGSWDIASLWKVAPRPTPLAASADGPQGLKPQPKGLLPAASIAFNGLLNDLVALTSSIEATSLQRDLEVRLVERRVEDLERLRQLDEERVRLERERRKASQDQRARDAAEARARRNGVPLPPILPESYGAGTMKTPPAPQTPPAASPNEAPQSGAAPAAVGPVPPAANAGQPADGAAAAADGSQPPVPASDGPAPDGNTAAPPPVGDPALEDQSRPVPRPRPPRQAAPRRSYTDEITRPLGGFP